MTERTPFIITGQRTALLGTEALRDHLADLIATARNKVLVISAFVTRLGVEWLSQQLQGANVACTIVTRWSEADLLTGASDVTACELAHVRGWEFRILPDLHAKVTLVDDRVLVVGSANLTGSGMSLTPASNREFGLSAIASPEDVRAAWGSVVDSIPVTSEMLVAVKTWLASQPEIQAPAFDRFPASLVIKLVRPPSRLYTSELPWTGANVLLQRLVQGRLTAADDHGVAHDLSLFGLSGHASAIRDAKTVLAGAISQSRAWRWLVETIRVQPNAEAWFGRVSELLHDALLDDPRPYRRDVKQLVTNLFSLCAIVGEELQVDRPNYSERLTFRGGALPARAGSNRLDDI